jgi:hypothetical protein
MQQYEEQIEKAEKALEAEWVEIIEEKRAEVEAPKARAFLTGAGEPKAAASEVAKPLPDAGPKSDAGQAAPAPVPSSTPTDPPKDFDRRDAERAFFATLRDAGIRDRREWCRSEGLPESVKDFTAESFDRVRALLLEPILERFRAGCAALELDPDKVALDRHNVPAASLFLGQLNALLQEMADVLPEAGEPGSRG